MFLLWPVTQAGAFGQLIQILAARGRHKRAEACIRCVPVADEPVHTDEKDQEGDSHGHAVGHYKPEGLVLPLLDG